MIRKTSIARRTVSIFSVGAIAALLLVATIPLTRVAADNTSPDSKGIYLKYCGLCHGTSGGGGMAVSLKNLKDPDSKLTSVITNGAPKGMPAFGKKLTADQITALVAYLHTLGK